MSSKYNQFTNLPVINHRGFKVTTSSPAGTPVSLAPPTITALSLTSVGTTATFTTSAPHRFVTGQSATIAGATPTSYNGTFDVTVTSATVFTYVTSSAPAANATGTAVATYPSYVHQAIVTAATTNDASGVSIGPDINSDIYTLTPGQFYTLNTAVGTRFDLSGWYVNSTVASQQITVLVLL